MSSTNKQKNLIETLFPSENEALQVKPQSEPTPKVKDNHHCSLQVLQQGAESQWQFVKDQEERWVGAWMAVVM